MSEPTPLHGCESEPVKNLGFAQIDLERKQRQGRSEVIYGEGKTAKQIAGIVVGLLEAGQSPVLITRLSGEKSEEVQSDFASDVPYVYYEEGSLAVVGEPNSDAPKCLGTVLVVTAGTSDIAVAEEAALTAEFFGNEVKRIYDIGVAGIHRTLSRVDELQSASVIIVVAGMEGALASVVGGLVSCPVIAVPTSVGYGAAFGGMAALLSMLNSCASGVGVVNIDNGFGAACLATSINQPACLQQK